MEKKILIFYILFFATFFFLFGGVAVLPVSADLDSAINQFETSTGLKDTGKQIFTDTLMKKTPIDFYGNIIKILLGFSGVAFFGYMIYGGYIWMLARGNQQDVDKAKKIIEQAIIGLVLILSAYAITVFIGYELSANVIKN